MTTLFRFVFFCGFMGAIIWFVVLQVNPKSICVNSPKKSGYYQCRPFGIEIKKEEEAHLFERKIKGGKTREYR